MHIAFLLTDRHSGRGGLETVLANVVAGLEQYDIQSSLLLFHSPEDPKFLEKFKNTYIMPVSIHDKWHKNLPHFLSYPLGKLELKIATKKLLHRAFPQSPPDALIILDLSKTLIHVLPVLKKYCKNINNLPLIAWPHGTIRAINPNVIAAIRNNIHLFDSFFAISKGLQMELKKKLNPSRTNLIYNPVKKANLIERNHRKFVYIGRIGSPDKRVKGLLRILSKLQGSWHLEMIGASNSEEKDRAINEYAKELGIHNNITFYGWRDEPWQYIQNAGILLLNSQYEGFGLVLVEAMMRGIPCLSSNCPVGPNEIIKEGINGWLYELNDESKCLSTLQKILDEELALPDALNIQKSVEKFQTEHVILNFKKALLQAINQQH